MKGLLAGLLLSLAYRLDPTLEPEIWPQLDEPEPEYTLAKSDGLEGEVEERLEIAPPYGMDVNPPVTEGLVDVAIDLVRFPRVQRILRGEAADQAIDDVKKQVDGERRRRHENAHAGKPNGHAKPGTGRKACAKCHELTYPSAKECGSCGMPFTGRKQGGRKRSKR